jgi:hypothetical protein
MLDVNGRIIEDGPEPRPVLPGDTRTFRVMLDCNQYKEDLDNVAQGNEVNTIIIKRGKLLYN